jgi:hypothetical protein
LSEIPIWTHQREFGIIREEIRRRSAVELSKLRALYKTKIRRLAFLFLPVYLRYNGGVHSDPNCYLLVLKPNNVAVLIQA